MKQRAYEKFGFWLMSLCLTVTMVACGMGPAPILDETLKSLGNVTAQGGEVCSEGALCLTFPEGAVKQDLTVEARRLPTAEAPAGALGPVYEFKATVETFDKEIEITIPVPAANQSTGMTVAFWKDNKWVRVETKSIEGGTKLVGKTNHLSIWGLVGVPTTTGCQSDADCGNGVVCISGQCASADAGPADNPPVDTPPDTGVTDTKPTDTAPDAGPTDTNPTDTPPADGGPADTMPTDAGPDNPPTDTNPTDNPPTDNPPADGGPADTNPTDTPPTDTAPKSCMNDAECGMSEVCISGTCQSTSQDGGSTDNLPTDNGSSCQVNADCSAGQSCVSGVCQSNSPD